MPAGKPMHRRTFLKAATLASASAALAACAPVPTAQPQQAQTEATAAQPAAAAPVTMQLANWEGGLSLEAIKASADKFNANNPRVQIDVFSPPGNYFEKIPAMIAAGTPPDIIEITETQTPQFAVQNVVIPLDDYIAATPDLSMDDFYPLQGEWQWGGKNYSLFYGFNNWALFYNKTLFDQDSMALPNDDWTYSDMAQNAASLTKKEGDRVTQWGLNWPRFYGGYFFQMWAYGGSYLDTDRKKTRITEAVTYDGLQYWSDLTNVHGAVPPVGGVQGDPFIGGLCALNVTTSWSAPDLVAKKPPFEWGVVLLPPASKELPRAITGLAAGWGIPPQNKQPEMAWEIILWTVGDMTVALAEIGASIPSRKSLIDTYWPDGTGLREPFIKMSDYVRAMETTPSTADQLKVLDDGIGQLWIVNKTAEQVATEIAPAIDALLAKEPN